MIEKILFVEVYNQILRRYPDDINLAYMASYMREKGFEVCLNSINSSLKELNEFIEYKPDIIAFNLYKFDTTNLDFQNLELVIRFISEMRKKLPGVIICCGGVLSTFESELILRKISFIDYIINGEAEYVFLDLVTKLNQGEKPDAINGISYRKSDEIITNKSRKTLADMDKLPHPARDMLLKNNHKIARVITSRGCMGNCSFCFTKNFWGKWRGRSPESVVDEIEMIVNQYNVDIFNNNDNSYEDSDVPFDTNRMLQIANKIIERELNVLYFVNMRVNTYKRLSQSDMEILTKSGMINVFLGVETGNEDDLKLYNKLQNIQDNDESIRFYRDAGIFVDIGFINFNPYSSITGLRKNISFLERHGFDSFKTILSAVDIFEGTRLFNKIKKDHLLIKNSIFDKDGFRIQKDAVEKLFNFLMNGIKLWNEEFFNNCVNISGFTNEQWFIQNIIKVHMERHNNYSEFDLINRHIASINEVKAEVNARNSKWFKELLDLADTGWNDVYAIHITEKILSKKWIKDTEEQLSVKNRKLIYDLYKRNSLYSEYLYL